MVRTVEEQGLKFEVNLTDYLDTGLFLDHRKTRSIIRHYAAGKRILNLFAYTGSFTVYARAGGAAGTTTVLMELLGKTPKVKASFGSNSPRTHSVNLARR